MNRVFVTILVIIFSLPLIFFIGNFILWNSLSSPRISPRQMERIFIADYDVLMVIVNYLEDSEHTSISFSPDRDEGYMLVHSSRLGFQRTPITDESVIEAIEILRERGYGVISKNSYMIRFLRWSTMGRGRGILYSLDGSVPDTTILTFFTMMEPLSKDGWFFYEEN